MRDEFRELRESLGRPVGPRTVVIAVLVLIVNTVGMMVVATINRKLVVPIWGSVAVVGGVLCFISAHMRVRLRRRYCNNGEEAEVPRNGASATGRLDYESERTL